MSATLFEAGSGPASSAWSARSPMISPSKAPDSTRLIAFDPAAERYFALADPELIPSADSLADLKAEDRIYFPFHTFAQGDIYFEPDFDLVGAAQSRRPVPATEGQGRHRRHTEPRRHPGPAARSLPSEHADLLLGSDRRSPAICRLRADHLARGRPRSEALSLRFLGRSMATRVVGLGADFEALAPEEAERQLRRRRRSPSLLASATSSRSAPSSRARTTRSC